jgi:2-keto-4-pentenoate hydratase/2-oxohepta-3-ene-1,7-dioic acid hydratase in catechol pathway
VDYEAELAVVMKDTCKNIAPDEVMDFVDGFTCLNDVTARDLQRKDVQWTRAKSFDTFCPVGPRIVKDIEPNNVKIQSLLNGDLKQDSSTSNFIFSVEELVSFVSYVMTLKPGDIIATGTPSGIGAMQRGDTIEIKIEGIGTLRNYVR